MSVRSRRPKSSPAECPESVVQAVLAASDLHPYWGARKLHALLWPLGTAPVCERTVGRILQRHERSRRLPRRAKEVRRFERETSNELWQIDFKKLGPRRGKVETLNAVDDATRFCLVSKVVPDQTLNVLWDVLWGAFDEFGLPAAMLSDNGPAFRNNATWRWSSFDLRLMLLNIRTAHGQPYHPQTQGKIERFHGTLERELGSNFQSPEDLETFRNRYNWFRPHEAIGLETPGSVYQPSPRVRPERMPKPFFPSGAQIRIGDELGCISFKGQRYKLGRSFSRLPVGILEDSNGVLQVVWGTFTLAPLREFKV